MTTIEKTIDKNAPMFPISSVADLLQVHQRTLRIYDDEGILKPSRSPKRRRLYSMNDIEKGRFIQYMTRDLGINLSGIKVIFGFLNLIECNSREVILDLGTHKNIVEEIADFSNMKTDNRERLSKRGRKKNG